MICSSRRAGLTELISNEALSGVSPSERHYRLLSSYQWIVERRGSASVRRLIISDLSSFLEIGAWARAADALVVLRLFRDAYPELARSNASAGGWRPRELTS
jgi:hypothetical protein